jgi:hypothetical protein
VSTTAPAPVEGGPGTPVVPTTGDVSLQEYARRWWAGVRTGDLGSLPIVIGLLIIAVVFQSQNSNFLTAGNFVNLIVQAAAYATIAMGIVFVLLLGEIDLSVGFVSGVAGVLVALLTFPDDHHVLGWPAALVLALAAGVAIGILHGLIITKVRVPSFVVTLAGLLAWNGAVLPLIGDKGTVIIQNVLLRRLRQRLPALGHGVDPRHRRDRALRGHAVLGAYARTGGPGQPAGLAPGPACGRPGARRARGRVRVRPGPRHPVRAARHHRPVHPVDLRSQPHAVRPS